MSALTNSRAIPLMCLAVLVVAPLFSSMGGGGGSFMWSQITGFPSSCPAGQTVTAVGTSLTCTDVSLLAQNYITNLQEWFKLDQITGTTQIDAQNNKNATGPSAWRSCIFQGCMFYSGSSGAGGVSTVSGYNFPFSTFTLSMWIHYNNVNPLPIATQYLAGQVSVGSDGEYFWVPSSDLPTFTVVNNTGSYFSCGSNLKLVNDEWTWLVFTFDGSQMIIYQNGLLATKSNQCPFIGSSRTPTGSWTFGNYVGPGTGFVGEIDDIRVYTSAISQSNVDQLRYWYATQMTGG